MLRAAAGRAAPLTVCLAALLIAMAGWQPVLAQQGPGGLINPQRDCQTLLTCNYRRGGYYRGCLSSYSCKVCRFVPARCRVGDRRRNCQRLRCSWG